MRGLVAFLCGALFAVGLAVSGMTHPQKILDFLDFTGDWDPSLLLVMGSGLAVNFVCFRLALRRGAPLLARSFALPVFTRIDARLLAGSALFGVGWGLGGFCPGPALVSVVAGAAPVVAFVAAMLGARYVSDVVALRAGSPIAQAERAAETEA